MPPAVRDLRGLDGALRERLSQRIDRLADEPRPPGSKKLSGHENRYRVRLGDYRIIYEVYDHQVLVLVLRVRHRKDAYR